MLAGFVEAVTAAKHAPDWLRNPRNRPTSLQQRLQPVAGQGFTRPRGHRIIADNFSRNHA